MTANEQMQTHLRSVAATAGFLEKCRVDFAPGLTCIIGARGTCKSTLIESIRFVFDAGSRYRVEALVAAGEGAGDEPWRGVIRATLGAGSLRCEVSAVDGADGKRVEHVLEREVDGATRLFQDGVREHVESELLHEIEIFSQGDLQRIADDQSDVLRMQLIDRSHARRVSELQQQRAKFGETLVAIGSRLRAVRDQIVELRQQVHPLPDLAEQLRRAKESAPASSPELDAEQARYARRRRLIEVVQEVDAVRKAVVDQLAAVGEQSLTVQRLSLDARGETSIEGHRVLDVISGVEAALELIQRGVVQLRASDLEPVIREIREEFERQNETFYQLRQKEQAVNESLKQRHQLERQIEELKRRAAVLIRELDTERDLLAERAVARAGIAAIDDELYALRIGEVEAINAEHGETVGLTLRTGAAAHAYGARLVDLLEGSRIRGRDEIASALASAFPPAALIDVVESANAQRLVEVLDRDLGQMSRLIAHLSDHPGLYALEAEPPATRLEITLYDNGEPKSVETLSKGQKATALLPLILRPLPYPLVFDQPEDDLDNKFIFASLIKIVRELKTKRQVIFVTHNANIPVLGGADRVIVMRMRSPKQAEAPLVGTVDERKQEILDLLEGGADAFRQREEQYGELLSERQRV